MKIEILGTGCPKCKKLAANAAAAVAELDLDCQIEKITDINEIIKRGIMMTPALAVDGDVKAVGKLMSVDDIKGALTGGCPA
ncbi:MAG: thioredoxin family protein [Alphaproteobacteria bacterium]